VGKRAFAKFADDREPWARQPGENDNAWRAFQAWRDLGPGSRTHAKVAELTGIKRITVANNSYRYRWRERSAAWDAHVDRVKREADLKAIRDMRERHIKMAQTFQALGMTEIGKYAKKSQAEKEKPTIEVRTAADLAERGLRLERLNRGEPETTHEETQRVNMTWSEIVDAARRQNKRDEGDV
jgi:hypothetical protein